MAKLRFYTCCLLFVLLFTGMLLVAAVFLLFWQRVIAGGGAAYLMQPRVLSQVFHLVVFYIFITALFLAFIGYFFLSRKLLQPIERLTGQAEQFSGGTDALLFGADAGEGFPRLSRALNHLVGQLGHEKEQLRVTVTALEKANADLLTAQQEMIRAEKLVSIGRLSAGLAHEIGNPLSILSGYLELLTKMEIANEQARDFISRAGKEASRMDTLIHRLLEFARPSSGVVQRCFVHQLIQECFDDLRCQPLFKDITFHLRLAAPRDSVMADPVQIRQILLNCLVNAADAIHDKKEADEKSITVTTANKPGDDSSVEWLVISLQDTGTGIASEHLPTLFDPFFTTKDAGKGTGLGLSVCYMILQEMGGTIEAVSSQGRGAEIKMQLQVEASS